MLHIEIQDINELLNKFSEFLTIAIGENLIGLYLMGSLTYGDFNPLSSDIDLVAIIAKPITKHEMQMIKKIHTDLGAQFPTWRERLECSYLPIELLEHIMPPPQPRPYFGGGVLYEEAPYGNEWIINNYLLHEHGIALLGPNIKTLLKSIDIVEVQKACIRDLFQEWEPKINDPEWLNNSHYQSYLVMNLCRILHTVICANAATKNASADWVKNHYPTRWNKLIDAAENWDYTKEMTMQTETINFLKFVIEQIKQTALCHGVTH